MSTLKKGVVLLNLGTPARPDARSVRRYLAEFLSDKRVINLPAWRWQPILRLFVLPSRSPRVAKLYRQIWTPEGSPLAVHTARLATELERSFAAENSGGSDDASPAPATLVRHAFTYGDPGPEHALDELLAAGVEELAVVPLYPQYSSTTTAAALDKVFEALKNRINIPRLKIVRSWPKQEAYIKAIADSIRQTGRTFDGVTTRLVFSYHGIPVSYSRAGDPYLAECRATSQAVAAKLDLPRDAWAMSFQSRFGRDVWLQPPTDEILRKLPTRGVRNLTIVCPGFAVDCLETLEEIAVENREIFLAAGGSTYTYVPCLNSSPAQVSVLKQVVSGAASL